MELKRSFLASVAIISSMLQINAAASYLTVELKAGGKYSFLLADKPVVTFSSGDLVVNGDTQTSYSIDGVKNFHFTEGDLTASAEISKDLISIVNLDESTIQIKNIESGSVVTLVNVSGVLITSVKADSEGTASVSLPQAKGVYILSVGGKSFKIIKK